jgi:uncharacterized membrane protein
MSAPFTFELPVVWLGALPLGALLGFAAWRQRRRGVAPVRVALFLGLRACVVLLLLFLCARPVTQTNQATGPANRPVVVMLDRSKSMSLLEADQTRYARAVDFLNRRLLPALADGNLPVRTILFDETAEPVNASQMISLKPEGKRTNIGRAVAEALDSSQKPLGIVALTDGGSNETGEDSRSMARLANSAIPFIGVGFGSDDAVQTLSLRRVEAPETAAPNTRFTISAEIESVHADAPSTCDLALFRDGKLLQRKTLQVRTGSRTWVERFSSSERAPGMHGYRVELFPPDTTSVRCVCAEGSTSVRVADGEELRVLYVQGAMTWDYKFISLASRSDPVLKLTGLTRTSQRSVFRQNVENANELAHGFPATLEELSPFRVVVLANIRPDDLSDEQQELLGQFCAERGGGVLMLGGPATFDSSWRKSGLEKLLPVVFSSESAGAAAAPEFHVQLSPEALQQPVFRLAEDRSIQEVWSKLPAFTQFGRVESAKRGAQVWLSHPSESGPNGRRILMASQRYGAGMSAVVCLQNFWRWRLAKETRPEEFDRFWRQLFRWLGDAGRQQISIQLADQELRPQSDIQMILEREGDGRFALNTNPQFAVQVQDATGKVIQTGSVELRATNQADFRFHAELAGLYTINVLGPDHSVLASRPVEIRDTDVELEHSARSMETLSRWAAVSDGLVFKAEECPKATDLVGQIRTKVEQLCVSQKTPQQVGVNAWTLTMVLSCLTTEWLLRKRWLLT